MLVDLVSNETETPAIRNAAAAGLADMTGALRNRRDPAEWQRWWGQNQAKDDATFARDLLESRSTRLVRLQQRFDRFIGETQLILAELYQAAPEKNKEPILLRDPRRDRAGDPGAGRPARAG